MKNILKLASGAIFLGFVSQIACAMKPSNNGSKARNGCVKKTGVLSQSLKHGQKEVRFDPELNKRLKLKRSLELIVFRIEHNQDVNEIKLRDGRSFLHFASDYGDVELVKRLLLAGAVLNAVDDNGQTALHVATECGCVDVVALLLRAGAKLDLVDLNGRTPLQLAEYNDHRGVVEAILSWQVNGMHVIIPIPDQRVKKN